MLYNEDGGVGLQRFSSSTLQMPAFVLKGNNHKLLMERHNVHLLSMLIELWANVSLARWVAWPIHLQGYQNFIQLPLLSKETYS